MRGLGSFASLTIGMTALGGCIQYGASDDTPLVVNVRSYGDECRTTVARNPGSQPLNFVSVSETQLSEIGRSAKGRRAILIYDLTAEYKCIGAAIGALQQAGLKVDSAPWESR